MVGRQKKPRRRKKTFHTAVARWEIHAENLWKFNNVDDLT